MKKNWITWTLLEAVSRSAGKIFQKIIGAVSQTVEHTIFAVLIIGLVQIAVGLIVTKIKKTPLFGDTRGILGSCLFGFIAVINSVLVFMVFFLGGEIGLNTFIITLSIIPGAFIDQIFFGHKLNRRQWFGILLAILAGYTILGWPSLKEFLHMPLWIWLSLITALGVAINQGVTQKVKKIDPFVKNFWGGLTTVVLCLMGLAIFSSLHLLFDFSQGMQKLWLASLLIGGNVIALWTFNLLSYKHGASIALKKLVMNGSFLSMSMIFGIVIFNETATPEKILGVLIYLAAFGLMDTKTWKYFNSLSLNKNNA